MTQFMLVAADAAKARIFTRQKKYSPLVELDALVHTESRLRRQDLVSDRPGQVHESMTPGESANEPPTDAKQKEQIRFAREVAGYLREARQKGKFSGLTLVAEPAFLGRLRKELDDETRKLVIKEVSKNIATQDPASIAQLVDAED